MGQIAHILHTLHTYRNRVFVILTLCLILVAFLNFNKAEAPAGVLVLPNHDISISLKIADVYSDESFTVSEGDTLLDALAILDELEPELRLETEYYEGLGALITSMYGMRNGTDKQYWQYEVNNVMPQIGAAAYELQHGDAVYWKFTESTY